MKKKFIAAVLAGAVMISGLSVSVMADKDLCIRNNRLQRGNG